MEANISKYHLVRLFKKEMGVTPNQYYIQNKLRTVKTKIMEEQSEVQIATELNYADQSHLCRQFKQLMGVSLQEYKRNVRRK
jgi:AraC-like DNA-binding protein